MAKGTTAAFSRLSLHRTVSTESDEDLKGGDVGKWNFLVNAVGQYEAALTTE